MLIRLAHYLSYINANARQACGPQAFQDLVYVNTYIPQNCTLNGSVKPQMKPRLQVSTRSCCGCSKDTCIIHKVSAVCSDDTCPLWFPPRQLLFAILYVWMEQGGVCAISHLILGCSPEPVVDSLYVIAHNQCLIQMPPPQHIPMVMMQLLYLPRPVALRYKGPEHLGLAMWSMDHKCIRVHLELKPCGIGPVHMTNFVIPISPESLIIERV